MFVLKDKNMLAFMDKYRLLVCLQQVRRTENILRQKYYKL